MSQLLWSRCAILWMSLSLLIQVVEADEVRTLGEARDEIADLQKSNERLRDLGRELLVGKEYEEMKLRSRKELQEVTITRVDGDTVHYKSPDGSGSVEIEDGPSEWAVLIVKAPKKVVSEGVKKPGDEVSNAIVVIEGDAGAGTGFMVKKDGQLYLYTAAHVLSGNRRLAVKLRSGRKITKFGAFEASEGADLVRIEVKEDVDASLRLASQGGQPSRASRCSLRGTPGEAAPWVTKRAM